jgi:rhodanese-related sulfurtransferase
MSEINATEARERIQNGCLIDVRTPAEFREVHATEALNLPLDRFSPEAAREMANDKPITLICGSGRRSEIALGKLQDAGSEAAHIIGGTNAWIQAGLPVERGKKAIALERQVRIAAGILIMTGVGLGYFHHPGWYGLSFFVGAGLTFAGITDTCGMGMMMAKMPWNR